ncbi:Uma2 family endonuclease [Streptomyces sp. NPDC049954]|uniref:Uma2 family endonuclease n=1 Tax=Streptomyces sp. NPDC049954 TaxID=3155779 RepID=UPI003431C1A3
MSLTEAERLHSQLTRFEDMFPGYRTEIVEGSIVMSPVRPHHGKTIKLVWEALEAQLSDDWDFTTDVAFLFDGETEFCPDLAVLPRPEVEANRSVYAPDLVELVVEVVSPGSVRRDYDLKPVRYAGRGIRHYLVFDPYRAECVTFWNPGAAGYLGRDTIPYGGKLTVETEVFGRLTVDLSGLPVDAG